MKNQIINNDLITFVFFFLLVVLFKFDSLNMPPAWDEMAHVVYAEELIKNNFIPYNITFEENIFDPYPIFISETYATILYLFGHRFWLLRSISVIFSSIGLFFTYKIVKEYSNSDIGILSSIVLFFSPFYFAQSSFLYFDIVLASLTLAMIYFYLKNNIKLYFILGILVTLSTAYGVFITTSFLLYSLFERNVSYKEKRKKISFALIFVAISFAWLYFLNNMNKLLDYTTQSQKIFFYILSNIKNPIRISYINTSEIFSRIINIIKTVYIDNFSFVIIISSIISLSIILKNKKKYKNIGLIILIITLFNLIALLAGFKFILIRRFFTTYTLLFIFFGVTLSKIPSKIRIFSVVILIILFSLLYRGNRADDCGCWLENNLEYWDYVSVHQQATKFIERNYHDATIVTTWPQVWELSYPSLGYVDKPIKIISIFKDSNISDGDLIYHANQEESYDYMSNIINYKLNTTLIKRFEKNGKFAEIYKINN